MRTIIVLVILVFAGALQAQNNVLGQWNSVDDESGSARSVVELTEKDGVLSGTILRVFDESGKVYEPICDECKGALKNKPITGMTIITDMSREKEGGRWKNGEILDPESGKVYDCEIWVEDGKLMVRGYLYFLYRTQTWIRANDE